jgi:hypothetical protein
MTTFYAKKISLEHISYIIRALGLIDSPMRINILTHIYTRGLDEYFYDE